MRSSVLKKVQNNNKTGSEGLELTELDNIILDVIGRDSPYLTGLGQEDEPPRFSTRKGPSEGDNSSKQGIYQDFVGTQNSKPVTCDLNVFWT